MRSVLILRGGNTGPLSSWNSFKLSAQAAGCQQLVYVSQQQRTCEHSTQKDMRTNELVDDAAAVAAGEYRAAGPCVRAHRLGASLAAQVAGEPHLLRANLALQGTPNKQRLQGAAALPTSSPCVSASCSAVRPPPARAVQPLSTLLKTRCASQSRE